MSENTLYGYLAWITPTQGDPTHSLLRAHLLFEQLIDAHFQRVLPHSQSLVDARFTFAQKLAIARASSKSIPPTHWTWQAVSRLNKIRNGLAHSPGPKLVSDLESYVDFCVRHSRNALPANATSEGAKTRPSQVTGGGPAYSAADMVTMGLYISLACQLGFDVSNFAGPLEGEEPNPSFQRTASPPLN